MNEDILKRLEQDLHKNFATSSSPTSGFWVVDPEGRIIPANAKHPDLEWIASVQTAPNGARNVPVICAASVMFQALKEISRDPARRGLAAKTREMIDEALTAAE